MRGYGEIRDSMLASRRTCFHVAAVRTTWRISRRRLRVIGAEGGDRHMLAVADRQYPAGTDGALALVVRSESQWY